jgi:Flp pilus assembly protein TadG
MSRTRRRGSRVRSRNRLGVSIVLVGVVLVTLVAFVSLAVDVGRMRLANAEVETAADAAARAGAWSLPVSTNDVYAESTVTALFNPCIATATSGQRADTGVALNFVQDIHFGFWDPTKRTFTPINDNPGTPKDERRAANAVYVQAW